VNSRLPVSCGLLLSLVLGASPGSSLAQEGGLSRKLHPWGRFEPGAWALVRVVTETLDEKGLVVSPSTAETTTSLVSVDKDSVTLEVQTTVEVAGKRFDAEPQNVKQGFHGETLCKDLKVKEQTAGQVAVEGRKIPCRIQQLECTGPTSQTVTRIYYSDTVPPYVLRREATTTDLDGENTLSETTVEVVAQDMPWKILAQRKGITILKTVHKHPKGTATTWTLSSADVPGGIVSHTSKEVDKSGRVIRRSTLELLGCGLQCDDEPEQRIGPLGRKRRPRLRDTSMHQLAR